MPPTNDFLPFCATDTSTNLIEQPAYVISTDRPIGNQPGIASSQLNNKALRQGTYIASQVAQFIANITQTSVLDNALPTTLLAQFQGAFKFLSPIVTTYLSSAGNWNATYKFQLVSANATVGATYTDGTTTYTVTKNITAGIELQATGNADPIANNGVLTYVSGGAGPNDATINYYATRKAQYIRVRCLGGGGGGGGGAGGGPTAGGNGSASSFGGISSGGGAGGGVTGSNAGGAGGLGVLGSGAVGLATYGGSGGGNSVFGGTDWQPGGAGGNSAFGGGGGAGPANASAVAAPANSGGGGGGAVSGNSAGNNSGAGGGAGGFVDAIIVAPLSIYAWVVGGGGSAGTGTYAGGAGGSGLVEVTEYYQ